MCSIAMGTFKFASLRAGHFFVTKNHDAALRLFAAASNTALAAVACVGNMPRLTSLRSIAAQIAAVENEAETSRAVIDVGQP